MSPRPVPPPLEPSDFVAALLWFLLQALALWWLISLAIGWNWLTSWFTFSWWAG